MQKKAEQEKANNARRARGCAGVPVFVYWVWGRGRGARAHRVSCALSSASAIGIGRLLLAYSLKTNIYKYK